jgi:MFS family permease
MLGLGAVPALAVFRLRRRIHETPRFRLAQLEAAEAVRRAGADGGATGLRGLLTDRRLLRWLIGASVAWLLFDFAYYGNTIASPMIVAEVAPHADLLRTSAYTLAIFAIFALPGYLIAAATIDHLGRRLVQAGGFVVMAAAFAALWLVPGATAATWAFVPLFGLTYLFAEFGPNTTTFVYPAEIFPVRLRTTSHGIAAAAGKLGGFVGTYALTSLLPVIGFRQTSGIVAAVCLAGAVVTAALLPEPKGRSLEELTEPGRGPIGGSVPAGPVHIGEQAEASREPYATAPGRRPDGRSGAA